MLARALRGLQEQASQDENCSLTVKQAECAQAIQDGNWQGITQIHQDLGSTSYLFPDPSATLQLLLKYQADNQQFYALFERLFERMDWQQRKKILASVEMKKLSDELQLILLAPDISQLSKFLTPSMLWMATSSCKKTAMKQCVVDLDAAKDLPNKLYYLRLLLALAIIDSPPKYTGSIVEGKLPLERDMDEVRARSNTKPEEVVFSSMAPGVVTCFENRKVLWATLFGSVPLPRDASELKESLDAASGNPMVTAKIMLG